MRKFSYPDDQRAVLIKKANDEKDTTFILGPSTENYRKHARKTNFFLVILISIQLKTNFISVTLF